MKSAENKMAWEDIYDRWKTYCEYLNSDVTNEPDFLIVKRVRTSLTDHNYPVDWWPKSEIHKRRNPFFEPGYVTLWRNTKAGTLTTAEMLLGARRSGTAARYFDNRQYLK